MTRESKIGLIVAGSFLCLVCIVIASKWNRGEAAPTDADEKQSVGPIADAKPKSKPSPAEVKKKEPEPKDNGFPHGALPRGTIKPGRRSWRPRRRSRRLAFRQRRPSPRRRR